VTACSCFADANTLKNGDEKTAKAKPPKNSRRLMIKIDITKNSSFL
jgi:hypothetical protein